VFGQTSEADFAACTARLKQEAQTAGISADVSNDVLDNVQWLERVIELDRQQPEFTTTFSDYYGKRVTPARVEKGREMLKDTPSCCAPSVIVTASRRTIWCLSGVWKPILAVT